MADVWEVPRSDVPEEDASDTKQPKPFALDWRMSRKRFRSERDGNLQ